MLLSNADQSLGQGALEGARMPSVVLTGALPIEHQHEGPYLCHAAANSVKKMAWRIALGV
jgi:hypothetical protein